LPPIQHNTAKTSRGGSRAAGGSVAVRTARYRPRVHRAEKQFTFNPLSTEKRFNRRRETSWIIKNCPKAAEQADAVRAVPFLSFSGILLAVQTAHPG
jgi:hypothetical protein